MFGHVGAVVSQDLYLVIFVNLRSGTAVHIYSGIRRSLEFTESPLNTPDCNLYWLDHKKERKKNSGQPNNLKTLAF